MIFVKKYHEWRYITCFLYFCQTLCCASFFRITWIAVNTSPSICLPVRASISSCGSSEMQHIHNFNGKVSHTLQLAISKQHAAKQQLASSLQIPESSFLRFFICNILIATTFSYVTLRLLSSLFPLPNLFRLLEIIMYYIWLQNYYNPNFFH